MAMIESLRLEKFRGFSSLAIDSFSPITLIGGRNNSGKTAILEAIYLHLGHTNPNIFLALFYFRNGNIGIPAANININSDLLWNPLFFEWKQTTKCKISMKLTDGKDRELILSKVPDDQKGLVINSEAITNLFKKGANSSSMDSLYFSLQYNYNKDGFQATGTYSVIDKQIKYFSAGKEPETGDLIKIVLFRNSFAIGMQSLAEIVSQLLMEDRKEDILRVLHYFDMNVTDIYVSVEDRVAGITVKLSSGQVIPLSYMGDGVNKALQLFAIVVTTPKGIVLIDEIENGLHHSSYELFLKSLYQTALNNECQLIITTHNYDILSISADVMNELNQLDKLSYQRIDRSGAPKAYHFSGEELLNAVDDNWEVR